MEKVGKTGIKRIYGLVTVVEVLTQFKSVAHVTQEITTIYPGRRMSNNKSTGLYDQPDDGQSFTSTRNALVPIKEGETKEQVEAQLSKFPEGCIQRVVTNNIGDILTDGDIWAMNHDDPKTGRPYFTEEDLKQKYETRDKDGNRYSGGKMRVTAAGEVVNDTLVEEYTRNFYQRTFVEDEDLRVPEVVTVESKATIVA
jgi:hypothetical protein